MELYSDTDKDKKIKHNIKFFQVISSLNLWYF